MQLPDGFVLDTPKTNTAPNIIRGKAKPVDPFKERDQQLQEAAAANSASAEARAAAKFQRETAEWEAAHNPDGTKKVAEGKPMPAWAANPYEKNIGIYAGLAGAANSFNDDFAGNTITGGLENTIQGVSSSFGTEGQRDWWAAFRQNDNIIRNELFGATLTPSEQAAYAATSINERMDPKEIRRNLGTRQEIVRKALTRKTNFLKAQGYSNEAIEALAGEFAPEFGAAQMEQPDLGITIDPAMLDENGQPKGYGPEDYATPVPISEWKGQIDPDYAGIVTDVFVDKSGKVVGYGLNDPNDPENSFVGFFDIENKQPPVNDNPPTQPRGLGDAFMSGVGDIVEGGLNNTIGLVSNPLNAGINAAFGTNLGTDLGGAARDALGLERGNPYAEAINKGAIGALSMAGGANALARTGIDLGRSVVTNALAQQPIQQGVGGATAGLASEATRQAGGGTILQSAAALAGGVGGFSAANRVARRSAAPVTNALAQGTSPRLIPNAGQVVQEGERAGVRVMTSDVRPPTTRLGKLGRNIGDSIPIAGTAGPRAKQQVERGDAVRKLMEDFGADKTAVDAVSADLVKTRGAVIGKLTDAKKSVIEGIKGAVPAPKAIAEIDKQIAKLKGIDDAAFKPVVDRLEGFKKALQSGKSLEQVEGQRRLLGDLFSDTSLASIKGDGQKAINAVYNPLKEDMGAFIEATAGPAAKAKWSGANERLSAMAGELDASAFKNLLNKAETTPESAAKIIFGKTPSDMRRLYGSLSEKGRAKAQSAILFQAAEKSTTNDSISPQKFATAMEAMSDATGVFFSPSDKARIDGMTRLIKATQHASDAAANPMTGAQNTPILAGVSIGQIFGTAALPATATAGLLARAYESKPVRDAFLRLGRTKRGSQQEKRAAQGVISSIAAANDNGGNFLANMPNSPASAAASERDDVEN